MTHGWTSAAVALGGNVGEVVSAFGTALDRLAGSGGCHVTAVSSLWRTQAWGKEDQPDFLNAVACVRTSWDAGELLARLQEEERSAGRTRRERWGPRLLDLDLLWHGASVLRDARLEVPHPLLADRSFVLAPALEVAPEWAHPQTGETLRRMKERLVASDGWTRCAVVAPADEWWNRPELVEPTGVPCRS